MKASSAAAIAAILVLEIAGPTRAEPLPVPKVGQCPAGYRGSGGYCAPTSDRAPRHSRVEFLAYGAMRLMQVNVFSLAALT
jgi:hypothetical protein